MNCWIEIDKQALRQNLKHITEHVGLGPQVMPVIKSNAYGHGLKEVYQCLADLHLPWLGVAYLEEAAAVRASGYLGRILMVAPILDADLPELGRLNAEVFLNDREQFRIWRQTKCRPKAHLKLDTGLSRQGFLVEDDLQWLVDELRADSADIVGLCSHFANVEDVLEHEFADLQINRFELARQTFRKAGHRLIEHFASSASTLILPSSRYDLCRVGMSLFGHWPSPATRLSFSKHYPTLCPLVPALSWKTQVVQVKNIPAGAYVGYGCTYRAPRALKIALLPVGYNEGFTRQTGLDGAYVLIGASRCAVLGRVSMNIVVVDVTDAPGVTRGSEVVLIGKDAASGESISAEQMAGWGKTIQYELLTRLNSSIARKVV